jgi:hypothetical protein
MTVEELREEARERIKRSIATKKKLREESTVMPPRYDEVFYRGVEWLDGL